MQKPKIPDNEQARLETLITLNLLDTEPEERFDRYTRLATKMFKVPIAAVSLVGQDRQWLKSRQGLDFEETPRDISFCGHAILDDQTLIVEDTKTDKRFADNPLVTQAPNIRFYAGRPIKAPDGSNIGTLCVIDRTPKKFNQEDIEALDDLARLVECEFKTPVQSTSDERTGLTNRRGFIDISHHVLTVCERTSLPATLLYFNLGNQKPANKRQNKEQEERAALEFSKMLLKTFRISDIIARLEIDEFCVLLTGADKDTTMIPLNRLYTKLDNFNAKKTIPYELDVSYGMVNYDRNEHHSITDLLAEADMLMYVQKNMRRSRNKI